jgi:hypothetical protein
MQALNYVILTLMLGGLSVWGSENLFWMMPAADMRPVEFLLTVVAYSIACGVALSAVIWSGAGGWVAVFLGGAVLGYMSEGVIVGTIYEVFPFQLVWTPLAWHALITGGLILGVGRMGARLGPARMALIWLLLGLIGAYWAQYWTSERAALPPFDRFAIYIVALGLMVPLAHVVMDRIGWMPQPRRGVLWVAPVIAFLVWVLQSVYDPNPWRIVLPCLMALILWIMWRLGDRTKAQPLGQPVPVWQHGLFMIAPVTIVALAPLGWAQGWGTLGANWAIALPTVAVSTLCLVALIWFAARGQTRP